MQVTRIYESPRVTKPYTDEQWAEIAGARRRGRQRAAGRRRAPDDGRRADLRVGGRPRRRRVEHRCAGPHEARLRHRTGAQAARRVRRRAASCTSARASGTRASNCRAGRCRSAGAPTASRCWHDPRCSPTSAQPTHYTSEDARRFTTVLAHAPRPDRPATSQPGYEDVYYYLWRERRLPVNVDPFDSQARRRDGARRACAACSTQKLDAVVGYVLPLQARTPTTAARPARGWTDRPLVPARRPHVPDPRRLADGLSAAARFAALGQQGRLALPGRARSRSRRAAPCRRAVPTIRAPLRAAAAGAGAERRPSRRGMPRHGAPATPPLCARGGLVQRRADRPRPARAECQVEPRRSAPAPRSARESADWITRTALCVEVRDPRRANGPKAEQARRASAACSTSSCRRWHALEDYLDLLAAVEATAAAARREDRAWKAIRRRAIRA